MERSGVFKTPLSRQVNEALRIKNSTADQRMNSGSPLENRRRTGRNKHKEGEDGGEGGRRKTRRREGSKGEESYSHGYH